MSKILESKKANYEMTQAQLADIYFSDKTLKPATAALLPSPPERPKASIIPWIITIVAFLVAAFALFSTKKIFIDIQVVDQKATYAGLRPDLMKPQSPQEVGAEKELPLVDESQYLSMNNFIFEGAAKLKSSKEKSMLTLVNSSVAPFARATLYFDPPLDMKHSKLVFYAKGSVGGENVALAIKDDNNLQAFNKGKTYPFPEALMSRWQKAEISLDGAAAVFNKANVMSLRFEFGSKDTENKPGDTLFIKDLQVVSV